MVPQRGLILSPAADQIPHRLVQRIQSGDFVEMRDLLADNVALHRQLEDLHSSTPPGCHSTAIPPPPPLKEIASKYGRNSVTGEMAGRRMTGPSAARPPSTAPYPGIRYCQASTLVGSGTVVVSGTRPFCPPMCLSPCSATSVTGAQSQPSPHPTSLAGQLYISCPSDRKRYSPVTYGDLLRSVPLHEGPRGLRQVLPWI